MKEFIRAIATITTLLSYSITAEHARTSPHGNINSVGMTNHAIP